MVWRTFRSRKPLRWVALAFLLASLTGFGLTYGKWEWNTLRHGSGWHRTVLDEAAKSGVPFTESISEGGISQLKLLSYDSPNTKVYVKDGDGNKWIFLFHRTADGTWTTHNGQSWEIEMIHSVFGGSAQRMVWWY